MAKLQPDYIKWTLTLNATQAQEEFHKLEKANKSLQAQANASRKAMAQLEAEGKKGSEEWNNLRKSVDQYSRSMAENRARMAEVSKRIDLASMSVSQLRKRMKDLQREFSNTSKATNPKQYNDLRKQLIQVQAALDKANTSARGLQGGFYSLTKMKQTLIGFFNGVGLTIFSLVTGSFKDAFNLIVDFERENSKLAAILGTSKDGIKDLEAAARQLGATTSYSAAQVTSLQIELAKLGFAKEQILQMEGAVLKFAKAVDTDLASASAFAGAALRIFDKDASETEDVLATFAVATTKTALDFSKLEASLSTVGPVANSFGLSIEDTTALLGMLANAGFDASSAATATRNIILNLCDANGDLAKALGAPVHNADELAKGLQKLNAEGVDLAKALELTDKRSVAAFSTFLNQADKISALRTSITGVTSEFRQMSATMADNVAGAMAGLRSAAEELVLKLSSGANPLIKGIVNVLTSLVQILGSCIEYVSRFSAVLKTSVIILAAYRVGIMAATRYKMLFSKATTSSLKALLLETAAMKAQIATNSLMRAGSLALSGAKLLLTGRINSAIKAFKLLSMTLRLNPFGLMVTAVTMAFMGITKLITSLKKHNEELERATQTSMRHRDALAAAGVEYEKQRSHLMKLRKAASDEILAKEKRLKAINELNKVIPSYNASIDAETGKYRENKKALDSYLVSLDRKLRMEANRKELSALVEEDNNRRKTAFEYWEKASITHQVKIAMMRNERVGSERYKQYRREAATALAASKMTFEEYYLSLDTAENQAIEHFKDFVERSGSSFEELTANAEENAEEIETVVTETSDKVVSRLKEINAELKQLRKADPKSDEELKDIEARIQALTNEKKALLDKNKAKHEVGTYREDSLDRVTAPIDLEHRKRLLDVNKNNGSSSSAELTIRKSEEARRHALELIDALEKLRAETKSNHTQTLDKIDKEVEDARNNIVEANRAIASATVQINREEYQNRLDAVTAFYDEQQRIIIENAAKQIIPQEAADLYLLNLRRQRNADTLAEMQRYFDELEDDYSMDADTRCKTTEKLQQDMKQLQSQILTDTGKFSEALREAMTDTTSAEGIANGYTQRIQGLNMYYEALESAEGVSADEIVALEAEKQRRIAALNYQYQEQMWQLQELTGLSWGQEYDRELAQLENYHSQGLIKEKDYQKKKLQLGVDNAKKYFDYYANLSGSMFSAIQDAEIARSDAKYDVLIQQAKNNGEDTAALEEEKENKKLEIQKKYADVDFAIKISEIIANTAVAIMTAYKQLGPIAGPIAAAMLAATGVAQMATAQAERDKIKNMQPGNTAGASATQPATAQRVLSGYSDGGYTGDGDRYEVAGLVHRGEYVVPKPIMDNPRVVDAVGMIEAIRRNKILGSGMPGGTPQIGYADGGFTASPPASGTAELVAAVKELRVSLKNLRAYVVLRDIEKANDTLDRARAPFTRNK